MFSQSSSILGRMACLSVLAAALFSLSACQTAGGSGNIYGYDFDAARISYQITGSSVGSSEVLIKGEKKVIRNNIVQTKVDGTTNAINTYLIQDGEKLYTLDPVTKTGSLLKQPFYSELQKLSPQDRKNRLISEALRVSSSPDQQNQIPQPEKTETIAGKVCDYYSGNMTKTCLWEGVPLHTVASLPDYGIQTETTATRIELNQPIADSEFAVPSDYKITDLN
jgi:hypothetical protein